MERIEKRIAVTVSRCLKVLYLADIEPSSILVQNTRKDQKGDFTVVVFSFTRFSGKNPELTATEIGNFLREQLPEIISFQVVKGFLNLVLADSFWIEYFNGIRHGRHYGHSIPDPGTPVVVVEFSSPNTNKPLHLGHIRNNVLGHAVSRIIQAAGSPVKMVNLVNDRGIHICKSMLAWQKWGNGITPEIAGIKGDKLVGEFYVRFDQEYKAQVKGLIESGMGEEEAKNSAPLILEAQELLRQWEKGNPETLLLWKRMNEWVYSGFNETYRKLRVSFDNIYYESETYRLGRDLVQKGLETGVFFQKPDGSVWADLIGDGLDQKLLLRSDGTSVYITQDLGTAHQRYEEYRFGRHIYVVGNEQDYHFKVLSLVLKKLGFTWADSLFHLSYGMVELPNGRMKSREGTVVDADDLIEGMIETAKEVSVELGKLGGFTQEEKDAVYYRIAMGALKYYILKVDPQKTMLFNPEESIDFNGNTGPFIQYTCVRIRSVERKAADAGITSEGGWDNEMALDPRESNLLKRIYSYPEILAEAADTLSPALIANYFYELVKEYNHFYQQCPILREPDASRKNFRLALSGFIADHIEDGMYLLGIEIPGRM